MANRKASITAQLTADRSNWTKELNKAAGDGRRFVKEVDSMKANPGFLKSLAAGGTRFTEMNAKATSAKNVVEEVYGAVSKGSAANAWYQDLVDGLTFVMGNAAAAKEHIKDLRLISDEQSVSDDGFEKMVQYSKRLQQQGYSAEFAAKYIREVANAAEAMGGSITDLDQVVTGLDRIDQKGEASLRNIIALTDSIPEFRKVLVSAFGTSSAQELEAMNLSAKELTEGILRGMEQIETARPSKNEESLAVAERKKQWAGADSEDNNGELPERKPMDAETAARAQKALMSQLETRRKLKLQEAREELAKEEEIQDLRNQIEEARADGNNEAADRLEDEVALLTEAVELAKRYGMEQQEANEWILRRNQKRRDTEAAVNTSAELKEKAQKTKDAGNALYDSAEDIAINEARAGGNEKRAKKLEREKDRRAHEQSLLGAGVDPAVAKATSERASKAQEDLEYFQDHGRGRIKGGKSRNPSGGLGFGLGHAGGFLTPSALDSNDPDRQSEQARYKSQSKARGAATPNERVEQLLTDIKAALISNKPSVNEKNKSR